LANKALGFDHVGARAGGQARGAEHCCPEQAEERPLH